MKNILFLSIILLLSACSIDRMPPPIKLDYTNMDRIYLNTKDLRIIDRSQNTPKWEPYIGHKFSPTLTDALYRLAGDRLQAIGENGNAKLIIKDANVIEQKIEPQNEISTFFTRQQSLKYIGRAEIALEAQAKNGTLNIATASAVYSTTLLENPTNAEKYHAYTKLLDNLIKEINSQLNVAINRHMKNFIIHRKAIKH